MKYILIFQFYTIFIGDLATQKKAILNVGDHSNEDRVVSREVMYIHVHAFTDEFRIKNTFSLNNNLITI